MPQKILKKFFSNDSTICAPNESPCLVVMKYLVLKIIWSDFLISLVFIKDKKSKRTNSLVFTKDKRSKSTNSRVIYKRQKVKKYKIG